MNRVAGVALGVVGLLVVVTGIAILFLSNAETWIGPLIVGGGLAVLGLFVTVIGWAVLRGSRRPSRRGWRIRLAKRLPRLSPRR
jgi:drug/metabolite transporter (DMT)-like permease